MPLGVGSRLGPYEIVGLIGQGGMGEVYRATDTNLGRQVAIKVLPDAVAQDAERLARFDREARTLAALNHPNIAQIYGVERSAGVVALVMELVEGEDLSVLIARGPISAPTALPIAKQIADALEAAHEQGIVHRDLKPANVKVRADGTVKVLDFGLAKAIDPASASGTAASALANSPTITSPAMTQMGMILGTAAYMAPEQARGRPADKRADIWAFGCVLFEMLTGRRPFEGDDVTETLAAVVMKDPDVSAAPPEFRRLLEKCLHKDPRRRLRDIGDVWELLDEARGGSGGAGGAPVAAPPRTRWVWPAVAAAALAAGILLGAGLWRRSEATERPLIRLSVDLGPDAEAGPGLSAVLSPDGTRLVFLGHGSGQSQQLYTRRLDQPLAVPLPGTTDRFHQPFFSPDGEWVGFRSAGGLKKAPIQGGSVATTIGAWPGTNNSGATWGEDGNIVLGSYSGLWSVPAGGEGPARQLTKGGSAFFPDILPGGEAVLFADDKGTTTTTLDDFAIYAVRIATGEVKQLVERSYWPRYLATSDKTGHLIYIHDGDLFGVAFDPARLELLGTPVALLDDVAANPDVNFGGGQLSVSRSGTLVYLSGASADVSSPLVWLDPAGVTTPLVAEPGSYGVPRFSPDGTRLAYVARGSKGFDVWVRNIARGESMQLTFLGSVNNELAWAPDSQHLVYGDGSALWWIRADGAAEAQLLSDNLLNPRPFSFSPVTNGRARLAYAYTHASSGVPDIATLPVNLSAPEDPKADEAEPFLAEPGLVEVDPAFSPDGRFLAYAANSPGSSEEEIYVRPFPGPGGQWKVSTGGGKFPVWSPSTHQIFFLGGDNRITVATYAIAGNSFTSGTPRAWSPTVVRRNGVQQSFDVSPDGTRVVTLPAPAAKNVSGTLHVTFLLNFFDEVRRRVPVGK
jgi:Tol biopolymer transport system component/tRNA A-37 threonylcarbamoyl transferase component Bud32